MDIGLDKNIKKYLKENEYPGRVVVIGMNESGALVMVYAIMGRTENSQNRFFENDGVDIIKTTAIDKTKVKDPELIIYTALARARVSEEEEAFIVTNGRQTDALKIGLELGNQTFKDILREWKHEPDAPNYTPRISGVIYVRKNAPPKFSLSIIKADPRDPANASVHEFFEELPLVPGSGFCISTYAGNGNPLPSFEGEPFVVPLVGDLNRISEDYWNILNPDYRVALAIKVIDPVLLTSSVKIINRNTN